MKINIDKLKHEEILADINHSVREKIVGGATIEASTSSFSFIGSHLARGSSGTFLITNSSGKTGISTTAIASNETGNGFSYSSSFAFTESI